MRCCNDLVVVVDLRLDNSTLVGYQFNVLFQFVLSSKMDVSLCGVVLLESRHLLLNVALLSL